jgi:hypothetical protein
MGTGQIEKQVYNVFSRVIVQGFGRNRIQKILGEEAPIDAQERAYENPPNMSSSMLVSQLRQLQSHRNKVEQLRLKRDGVFEKAIADIEALDRQIEDFERGENGQKNSTKKHEKSSGEIKVFDAPGRGRRPCPSCGVYVGVRTPICICGYNFDTKKKGKPPVSIASDKKSAKRGRKSGGGMTSREAVISVLEEASSNNEKLRLGEVVERFLKKYPSEAQDTSIGSMVSGILGKLVKEGVAEKDEERRHMLKPVSVKKSASKKSVSKKPDAKKPASKKPADTKDAA